MIALLLVAVCLMAAILIGGGWLVPKHVAEQAAVERLREHRRGLAAKQCSHSSVPWPVVTTDGMLVAWLCGDCMEQVDTFTCPPVGSKHNPWKPNLHECEWDEIRRMDGLLIRSCRICGARDLSMSEEVFRAGWTHEGEPKHEHEWPMGKGPLPCECGAPAPWQVQPW